MIKAIRGTKDILPFEISRWHYLENIIKHIFSYFNYKEIRTPVFEETTLFARSIGEETDIVSKEMYTFRDKGDTSITLKPEMTAGVVRAFIEHSLGGQQPLTKLFYISPMFRQERPQAGRLRQFHQFGGEALGSLTPVLDAELIQISYDILKSLGLKDLTVKINSLGVPESREEYKKLLRDFLLNKKNKLSEDSRKRFDTNIFRIFDSKIESDQELLEGAPLFIDHLDEESKNHFEVVKEYLDKIFIPFEIDPRLVRGLDYYTKTTFEIISKKVGSQSALVGGGRYDLLAEQLGGKPTPAVGFAAGMERILLACESENSFSVKDDVIDVYIVRIDEELDMFISETASNLRRTGLKVDYDYLSRSVKAQMREANKLKTRFVLLIGGEEFRDGEIKLKDMKSGEEINYSLNSLDLIIDRLKK
jgi:histidyl-tRNA synthetase